MARPWSDFRQPTTRSIPNQHQSTTGYIMSIPSDRKYTSSHEWVKAEGDVFLVGITDDAQDQLGDHVFVGDVQVGARDRKSTRLNSSHVKISYAVFCLKKKNK